MRAIYTLLMQAYNKSCIYIYDILKSVHALFFCCVLILLSGCSDKHCIDADDFGFPEVTVKAYFEESELEGSQMLQVAPWIDSGYILNGDPVTILVKNWYSNIDFNNKGEVSAWCPWYSQGAPPGMLSDLCQRLQTCQFDNGVMTSDTGDLPVVAAPCLLDKGKGLYAFLAKPNYDPNLNISRKKIPSGINFHVGEPTQYNMFDIDRLGNSNRAGGAVYSYASDDQARLYTGGNLFFKILDKFYEDNNGQYRVIIKSGVDIGSGDPVKVLTDAVKTTLYGSPDGVTYGVVEAVYRKIVLDSGFKTMVKALITLYVVITTLSFLAGMLEVTHTEFIKRVVKITIVSVLLSSDQSWTFFKDYLFVFFIEGVQALINIIQSAGAGGPGSINILGLMMAQETFIKLFSLFFTDYLGFLYIILYIILLAIMFRIIFVATVIYLTSLVTISMIIIMAPFFISCLLFDFTRTYFDNWLKQLTKYALIPIILFTGITFMGTIIRHEIYASLGFKVCKRDLFTMPNLQLFTETDGKYKTESSLFYWWYPSKFADDDTQFSTDSNISATNESNIPIPEAHMERDNHGNYTGRFCKAYECSGLRDVDYPFLDLEEDKERLDDFRANHFVNFKGILILFVMVYLLDRFNKSAEMIAMLMSNTMGSSSIATSGARAASGIASAGSGLMGAAARAARGASYSARRTIANKMKRSKPSTEGTKKNTDNAGSRAGLSDDAISRRGGDSDENGDSDDSISRSSSTSASEATTNGSTSGAVTDRGDSGEEGAARTEGSIADVEGGDTSDPGAAASEGTDAGSSSRSGAVDSGEEGAARTEGSIPDVEGGDTSDPGAAASEGTDADSSSSSGPSSSSDSGRSEDAGTSSGGAQTTSSDDEPSS